MLTEGKIIVILDSGAAAKTDLFLSISGQMRMEGCHIRPSDNRISIQLCSKHALFPSHLNVREIMNLGAALHGLYDWERIERLLETGGLMGVSEKQLMYYLPRFETRVLSLLWSILPDPDLILIDDLADGLSLPARRELWQLILYEQKRRPRIILYLTQDLEAARVLGDEIWFLEGANLFCRWVGAEIPAVFQTLKGYAFIMKTTAAAQRFFTLVKSASWVKDCAIRKGNYVEVVVTDADKIVDLTLMAGFGLQAVQSLPLGVERFSNIFCGSQVSSELIRFPGGTISTWKPCSNLNIRQLTAAITQLGFSEWRQHFRTFWKIGNIVLSSIWLMAIIQIAIMLIPDRNGDFHYWAPILLLSSSMMALGIGTQSISRLTATAETATLFQKAQPRSRERPFSTLLAYDLTATGRRGLLAGMLFGQYLILMTHSWPLLLFLVLVGLVPSLLATGFLYWTVTSLSAMALAVILGSCFKRPGVGRWLGWVLWLPLGLGSLVFPDRLEPYSWLWPFVGFTKVFRMSGDSRLAVMPLGLAILGTLVLWVIAQAVFSAYPAIWRASNPK